MRIRVDEAGDFNYDDVDRFWVSVVAGVAFPDSRWAIVRDFVWGRCAARGDV